jgi:hypothetical protein
VTSFPNRITCVGLVASTKRQARRHSRGPTPLPLGTRPGLLLLTVELRDLTRRRKKLLSSLSAEKNRIQKVLEVANVKIGNIVSDVFGVSGQAIVNVLISGQKIPLEKIADLSKGRLRQRIPELTETLDRHQMNEHHRWFIRQSVDSAGDGEGVLPVR